MLAHKIAKHKKRLFWRGDVVVMKVQPESEKGFIVGCRSVRLPGEWFLDSLELECEQSVTDPLDDFNMQ